MQRKPWRLTLRQASGSPAQGRTLHRKGIGDIFASSCLGGSIARSTFAQSRSVHLCHLWTRIGRSGHSGDLAVQRVAGSGDPATARGHSIFFTLRCACTIRCLYPE